jgi:hypothetical protein
MLRWRGWNGLALATTTGTEDDMDSLSNQPLGRGESGQSRDYEPPRVERVLTPAELEREILYAGQDGLSVDAPLP